MNGFFSSPYEGPIFSHWTPTHTAPLVLTFLLVLFLFLFSSFFRSSKPLRKSIPVIIVVLFLVEEISYNLWKILNNSWNRHYDLPVHLCSVSSYACCLMMVFPQYPFIYEFAQLLGAGGALQGLLFPQLDEDFPHYRYWNFWLCHLLLFVAPFYITIIERPGLSSKSCFRTIIIGLIYMFCVGFFNWIMGSNYMFLSEKPSTPSPYDLMHPWPWYLGTVICIAILNVFVFYLICIPFNPTKKKAQ